MVSDWTMFGLNPQRIVVVDLESCNGHDLMNPMDSSDARGTI